MGQQVNFYLTPKDVDVVAECIDKCGDYLILHSRSPTRKSRIVPSFNFKEDGHRWLFFNLVRPEDLAAVKTYYIPEQKYWMSDHLVRPPILEFNSCYYDGKKMRRGRLYFQTRYYAKNGELVTQPDSFLKWGRRVLAAIKKPLHYDPDRGVYIGPDTMKWVEEKGGKLLRPGE
jgi:hypothetical protein